MPIIQSLLDIDFYKLTMAQVAWDRFSDVKVKFSFTNRTRSVALSEIVSEERIRGELAAIRSLRFTDEEIRYLTSLGHFSSSFLYWLKCLQLPEILVEKDGPTYRIEAEGRWCDVSLWETLVLSVVNELYYRALIANPSYAWPEGAQRFEDKCRWLAQEKYRDILFIEFGTRRRFLRVWQEYIVEKLAIKKKVGQLPGFVGTSNVFLAKKFGLKPIGTFAHEMFMVYAGIFGDSDDGLRASHNKVLQDWRARYGPDLSVALTDTFGSDFCLGDFSIEQAREWDGLRHDSGNPFRFGEKVIAWYESLGIDPKTKTIVFSDGLEMIKICALWLRFKDRIGVSFGWGTNLTNDMGHAPLSLVMKAVEADGRPTVKLSDNPAKAMGPAEEVERYKRVFGHSEGEYETCTY